MLSLVLMSGERLKSAQQALLLKILSLAEVRTSERGYVDRLVM